MSEKVVFLPTPSDRQIARSNELGDALTHSLIAISEAADADPCTVEFCVWINLIHALTEFGWTKDELIKEVKRHAHAG